MFAICVRSVLLIALLLAVFSAGSATSSRSDADSAALSTLTISESLRAAYSEWREEHGHSSNPDFDVGSPRSDQWLRNDAVIEAHNSDETRTFDLGHNAFSHLSLAEFSERFHLGPYFDEDGGAGAGGAPRKLSISSFVNTAVGAISSAFDSTMDYVCGDKCSFGNKLDWRKKGAVTSVKDQGKCGSCWAFSAVGAIEGAYAIAEKSLVDFSVQMLVDCDDSDMGCGGGLMDYAFEWEEREGGLCTAADYPYTGRVGTCMDDECDEVEGSELFGFVDVKVGSTSSLREAITKQPVSVAINANSVLFQLYKSGVFSGPCGSNLDHGVLAVGYGFSRKFFPEFKKLKYAIIKNSWGDNWGEQGFIRMALNDEDEDGAKGTCGILLAASYPEIVLAKD